MFNPIILGLAFGNEEVKFEFRPRVGEKYRYRLKMTIDDQQVVPDAVQAFTTFKVTGSQNGVFTIHQSFARTASDGSIKYWEGEDYKVDRFLTTQTVLNSKAPGKRSQAALDSIGGCFGAVFPFEPVHEGEKSLLPYDAEATTKEILQGFKPVKGSATSSKGGWIVDVERIANDATYVSSKLDFSFDLSKVVKGKTDHMKFNYKLAQTASFDRLTGMPVLLHRITNQNVVFDGVDHKSRRTIHLELAR